jgi:hypothetical protein
MEKPQLYLANTGWYSFNEDRQPIPSTQTEKYQKRVKSRELLKSHLGEASAATSTSSGE